MRLSYGWLKKRPRVFKRISGISVGEMERLCERVRPLWEGGKIQSWRGRPSHFKGLEDRILALLMYYRTYITHELLGCLFGLHNANISRQFQRLEPLLAQVMRLKKQRCLSTDQVMRLLVDVTEQPIQRPKKAAQQKKHYSGKKKRHTRKVEIVMSEQGEIVSLSKSVPGSWHDFKLRQSQKPLPPQADVWADLGYQGLQKRHPGACLPYKRRRGYPLTPEQKHYNRLHARFRIRIEHKIRELKIFKILADTYRNFTQKHHLRFNIIAGLVNLRHGF